MIYFLKVLNWSVGLAGMEKVAMVIGLFPLHQHIVYLDT